MEGGRVEQEIDSSHGVEVGNEGRSVVGVKEDESLSEKGAASRLSGSSANRLLAL